MKNHLDRALILFQQSRHDLAERELRQALAQDPENPPAHALLALCLTDQDRLEEATREAQTAVHQGPDLPFTHFAMARVFEARNRLDEARRAAREAIRLDPYDADHFALLASIEMQLRQWDRALEAARRGLEVDPEHVDCTNIRAMALVNLGRRQEAGESIDAALSREPENAATHANKGWTLLHARQPRQAMEHFREALRLEPGMEWAQRGILEALKARNPIYRWLLAYALWMSRLSGKAQWGVVLGLYFGFRILRGTADKHPELAPYLYPILIAYIVFALLTWIGDPLFNLLLRFHKFGRLVLSPSQVMASNVLAVCLGGALLAFVAYLITGSSLGLFAALVMGLLTIPISGTWRRSPGWPRRLLVGYTVILATAGVGAVVLAAVVDHTRKGGISGTLFWVLLVVFLLGTVLFGFVANAMAMVRVKR